MESIRKFVSSASKSEIFSIPSYVVARRFEYANAANNCAFTDAFIAMEKIDVHDGQVIYLSELFRPGLEILEIYENNGNGDELDGEAREALECLINFFNSKDMHLKCILKCMEKPEKDIEKAEVAFVLAEHIFGPLIPGGQYLLDQNCPNSIKHCPGGCGKVKETNTAHTGIGHSETWHGFVDILLGTGITVSVFQQTSDSHADDGDADDDDADADDGNSEGDDTGEPPPKQIKYTDDNSIPVMTAENAIMQTVARTIVNAYLNSKHTSCLIPSLSACLEYCMIFMYHPKSDLFLMCPSPFMLLDQSEKNIYSDCQIIFLWMILNYEICSQTFDKSVESLKSGFHKFAKDKLSLYSEQLLIGEKSFPLTRGQTAEIKEVNVRKNILSM